MIVLDTHAWIWYVNNPDLLSRNALSHIEHAKTKKSINISSISIWEICMLIKKERLVLSLPVQDWIEKSERLSYFNFIPVDNAIAVNAVSLNDKLHSDPADRIIIATALMLKLPLITKDSKIIEYEAVPTIW